MSLQDKLKVMVAGGLLALSSGCTFDLTIRIPKVTYRSSVCGETCVHSECYGSRSGQADPFANSWQTNYRPGSCGVAPAFRDPPYVEPRYRRDGCR